MAQLTFQDIQLANFVLGHAMLFRLPLPQGWRLKRGFAHPDLHATHRRGHVVWVASADAHYLLQHEEGPTLEFTITVRAQALKTGRETQPTVVGPHPAREEWATIRRGPPWRRREARRVRLTWSCPETERHFRLELVGRVPDEMFQELLTAWQRLRCHG